MWASDGHGRFSEGVGGTFLRAKAAAAPKRPESLLSSLEAEVSRTRPLVSYLEVQTYCLWEGSRVVPLVTEGGGLGRGFGCQDRRCPSLK